MSYLYLLVDDAGQGFKIGVSNNPSQRIAMLPEIIDVERSFQIKCGEKNSYRVEKALHLLFRSHHLKKEWGDGYTEWFSMDCFEAVQEFIRSQRDLLAWTHFERIPKPEASNNSVHRTDEEKANRKVKFADKKKQKFIDDQEHNRNVLVENQRVGDLFKSGLKQGVFFFRYDAQCPLQNAVSLTMPVVSDPYPYDYKHQLHPIFDMNLPEGELRKHLRRQFSKAVLNFDDLAFLKIIGQHQIGRLRFDSMDKKTVDVPAQSVRELISYDGAKGLFESLLDRYAVYSGISGVQPKVMIRNSDDSGISRITHQDATHIVKAWNPGEFPQLAANEYFCMRAALHAKLEVPNFELSDNGKFLIVERFDLAGGDSYLGFEDFCVLNGKSSEQKYESSYENITKRVKEFVSTEQVPVALESFFKTLALSCAVKNGDAHLKNFGVLYADTETTVRLSPAYDIASTTPYIPGDLIALTLGGSKAWPKEKALVKFARQHCNITDSRAKELMGEVAEGMVKASHEMVDYIRHNDFFKNVGEAMLVEWNKGLSLSIMAENRTVHSTTKGNAAATKNVSMALAAKMSPSQRVDLGRLANSVDGDAGKEINENDLEDD